MHFDDLLFFEESVPDDLFFCEVFVSVPTTSKRNEYIMLINK